MNEPLSPGAAKALIVQILDNPAGRVEFSPHALKAMADDNMTFEEMRATLRGGVVEPAELVRGSWRYRVRGSRKYAVVAFHSEVRTVVVTVWRTR